VQQTASLIVSVSAGQMLAEHAAHLLAQEMTQRPLWDVMRSKNALINLSGVLKSLTNATPILNVSATIKSLRSYVVQRVVVASAQPWQAVLRAWQQKKRKQYTNARQRLQDIIGLNETAINVDTTIAGQAQRSGDAAANRAAANARQAASIAAQMTQAEMNQAYREADLRLRAEQGNLNATIQQARN
jgi:hypothetical protein